MSSATIDDVPERTAAASKDEAQDSGGLVRELLLMWRDLEPFVNEDEGARLSAPERRIVHRWYSMFEPEILYVQSARNVVAHSPDTVPASELRGAVKAAAKLRELLFSGLEHPVSVLGEPSAEA